MFLLKEDQKKSFMKILYNVAVSDREFSEKEENLLHLIATEIFKLRDYPKTSIDKTQLEQELKNIEDKSIIYYLLDVAIFTCKDSAKDSGKKATRELLRYLLELAELRVELKEKITKKIDDI